MGKFSLIKIIGLRWWSRLWFAKIMAKDLHRVIHFYLFSRPTLLRLLRGRNVAVVGGSPDLVGRALGETIDAHDIVVRVNYKRGTDATTHGRRFDLAFVGAQVESECSHEEIRLLYGECTRLLSCNQNSFLKQFFPEKNVLLYPSALTILLPVIVALQGKIKYDVVVDRLPRSGFLAVSFFVYMFQPTCITLFGFSKEPTSDYTNLDRLGRARKLEEIDQMGNRKHCTTYLELKLMRALLRTAERRRIKVNWIC